MMLKRVLLDILDYLHFQVENDKCTAEEVRSIYETLVSNMAIDATISDMARHYGQSESNVRNVVARRYRDKPKRRVYFNLVEFMKNMPKSWNCNR